MAITLLERESGPGSSDEASARSWPVHEMGGAVPDGGTLIVVTSGKSRSIFAETRDARLLFRVCRRLAEGGVHTINPELPLREDGLSDDDDSLLRLRHQMAADAFRRIRASGPVLVLGMSLGVQTVLSIAEDHKLAGQVSALVLISGVIERPVAPVGSIRSVDLIFGSRDHVAYLAPGSNRIDTLIPPGQYGLKSAGRLVLGPAQQSTMMIVDGAGHALDTIHPDGLPDLGRGARAVVDRIASRLGLPLRNA